MTFQAFLIKYAEIGIKGKNRYIFEDALIRQIELHLERVEGDFTVTKAYGRIYVNALSEYDYEELIAELQKVFGIVWICPVLQLPDEGFSVLAEKIVAYMGEVHPDRHVTFKVDARRARKNYPLTSQDINIQLGEVLLDAYPELKVDVHKPQLTLRVEVRDQFINVYSIQIPGPGGMPLGTAGRATLLLSGGIDSPVAGYMIAKRGVTIDAVYFHAPPYTSERARKKVEELASLVAKYAGPIQLHIVNFTDIQLYIYEKCPHEQLTIIMRRYMMRIAESIAKKNGSMALITGESIGQVASQTIQSLNATNEVCTLPVFRPVIAFDKQEIVTLAEQIHTYETSIQPYEDCCTIFVAKHPVTKPSLNVIHASERKLEEEIDRLVEEAMNTIETVVCRP
ncbi:MAG: tRNA 4-thiouridine(8) synthase ThiI [Lachnospiraceae bacterium]|nr:tRNA 4-thiouridine(8) synthase ThiI [Lachnospiraceae bacterium]